MVRRDNGDTGQAWHITIYYWSRRFYHWALKGTSGWNGPRAVFPVYLSTLCHNLQYSVYAIAQEFLE